MNIKDVNLWGLQYITVFLWCFLCVLKYAHLLFPVLSGSIFVDPLPIMFITLTRFDSVATFLRRVHNILSPFRDNRKPLIFQWAFTLRNAGIGSGSNPAFYTLKNEWLPVVHATKRWNRIGF